MPIEVACTRCHTHSQIASHLDGKTIRCPRCKGTFKGKKLSTMAADHAAAAPARSGPAFKPSRSRQADSSSGMPGWLLAGMAGAAGLVVLGVIGIAAWSFSGSATDEQPAEVAQTNKDRPADPARPPPPPPAKKNPVPRPDPRPIPPPDEKPIRPPVRPPEPAPTRLKLPSLPAPLLIQPPPIKYPRAYKLPEQIARLRVGGGGRFLIMHFIKSKKLGVFDINQAKIVRMIPAAAEDDVLFAAGMTKLLVFRPAAGVLERFDLLTGKREKTAKFQVAGGKLEAFCMGHASAGPLLVSVNRAGAKLYDIDTFEEMPLPEIFDQRYNRQRSRLEDGLYWAGATGRIFGNTGTLGQPSGVKTIILRPSKIELYGAHKSTWYVIPGPDEQYIFAGGHGVLSPQVQKVDNVPFSMGDGSNYRSHFYLPAHRGPYYLHAQTYDHRVGRKEEIAAGTIRLFALGNMTPVATLSKTAVMPYTSWITMRDFGVENSIHLIPDANLLVLVPAARNELRLYPIKVGK